MKIIDLKICFWQLSKIVKGFLKIQAWIMNNLMWYIEFKKLIGIALIMMFINVNVY